MPSPSTSLEMRDRHDDPTAQNGVNGPSTQETPKSGHDPVASIEPVATDGPSPAPERTWITGWRLYLLVFGTCSALFLTAIETTIVSTSVISITNALHGFEQRNWLVTSYLLTFTGFLVIYAKFSDVLGRKSMILLALALFTIFSIVCGSISSMDQLIIFRAFQGMGASGIYAMVNIINPELVPVRQWGTIVAVTSMAFVVASTLGPVLGGVINNGGNWRWVFLLNAPAGVIVTAIISFLLPANFPNQGPETSTSTTTTTAIRQKFSRDAFKRLDLIGAAILLASSILLVFAFEEAGTRFAWNSPVIISTLVAGGVLFVLFFACEHTVGKPKYTQEPVFPLRLLKNRQFVGLIMY